MLTQDIIKRCDILSSYIFKGFVQNTELSDWIFQRSEWIIGYCIVIFDLRKLCFLEAILHGLFCNLIPCSSEHFHGLQPRNKWEWLFAINCFNHFCTNLFLYLAFKESMTPCSINYKVEVVFGGRKKISIAFNLPISGWVVQLSMMSATFRFYFSNWLFSSLIQFSESVEFIQFLFWRW